MASGGPTSPALASMVADARIVICCGSGGVGKTTIAAAIGAVAAQRQARRVLVLTIDPARRLATALGLASVGNTAAAVEMPGAAGQLSVAMLDTAASWDDLVRRHAPDGRTEAKILANPLYRNITQRFVQSHDYIAMERLYEIDASGAHDLLVIDTPPSRHALDFLDAPERMAEFFSSALLRWITLPYRVGGARAGRLGYLAAKPFYQVADRILGSQFLEDIAEFFLLFQSMYDGFVGRARAVQALLRDSGTRFAVVTTPEPAPLHEAEFFMEELQRRRLALGALILNRVMPPWLIDPRVEAAAVRLDDGDPALGPADSAVAAILASTFRQYASVARGEEVEIRRLAHRPDIVARVPLLDHEITDVASLLDLGAMLWA